MSEPQAENDFRTRNYFPELDGLRFLAFLLVYLFHHGFQPVLYLIRALLALVVDPILGLLGDPVGLSGWLTFRLVNNGWSGVYIFFVLSGFIITTLLLREERRSGRIDVKAFWIRRALRIWPLYYFMLLLGFGVLPALEGQLDEESYWNGPMRLAPAFFVFLGNWAMIWQKIAPAEYLGVLWSLCVEEQFYLVVPFLLTLVPRTWRVAVILLLMVVATGYRYGLAVAEVDEIWLSFDSLAKFDILLSGVLLALILDAHPPGPLATRWAKWLRWPVGLLMIFVLTRSQLTSSEPIWRTFGAQAIYLATMLLMTVTIIGDNGFKRALSAPWIVYLGRISYGLYVFHILGIKLGYGFIRNLLSNWSAPSELVALGTESVSLGGTILMAALSYRYLERPFLKLKQRFTQVPSRPI